MKNASSWEVWIPWAAVVVIVVLWEALCRALSVPEFVFPGPIGIAKSMIEYREIIARHASQTFLTTMAGFSLGVAVGMILGAIVGSSRFAYKALYPLLVGFNAAPKSAFVPILVVWFGVGTLPAIITTFLICFFPIVVNVATGLTTLEPELTDVLRALGASRLDVLLKAGIPHSLPYFFASLKVAITLAFVGSVLSETVAANAGIGYLLISAAAQVRIPLMFAGLVVVSAMAILMYALLALLEKRMAGWAMRGTNVFP